MRRHQQLAPGHSDATDFTNSRDRPPCAVRLSVIRGLGRPPFGNPTQRARHLLLATPAPAP
ncbi:hypothetical protein [Streptomyces olivaceoviridis]|uniref:hypothetical protein n=1 Tax=Streptomyces olivaceoviridis TaxID=1921 RepID=UPI0036FA2666